MAHNVEPMDIDNIESDFDNKENSIHHSNVYPRTPCTEKGYEELDVSELNMKLRYSITPAASPMSKSYTANCADSRNIDSRDDTFNANLTRSLNSAMCKSDIMNKSVKTLPLQTIPSDQLDSNRNASVLRPLESTVVDNNVTVTITHTDIDENISFPSSSSSVAHTPEATTPTKEIPRNDGGSPIMRGLKSVFNMFRSSQSPIPPADGIEAIDKQVLSPVDASAATPDSSSVGNTVLASTPLASHKLKETNVSKRSSPHKESLVFNDDLERELLWKDETTVLFSEEKIPIHKLFPQPSPTLKETAKVEKAIKAEDNLNSTVEYMDISYNDSVIKNKTITDLQSEGLNESDSEFLDCETTFSNKLEVVATDNDINIKTKDHAEIATTSIEETPINVETNLLPKSMEKESQPDLSAVLKDDDNLKSEKELELKQIEEELISNLGTAESKELIEIAIVEKNTNHPNEENTVLPNVNVEVNTTFEPDIRKPLELDLLMGKTFDHDSVSNEPVIKSENSDINLTASLMPSENLKSYVSNSTFVQQDDCLTLGTIICGDATYNLKDNVTFLKEEIISDVSNVDTTNSVQGENTFVKESQRLSMSLGDTNTSVTVKTEDATFVKEIERIPESLVVNDCTIPITSGNTTYSQIAENIVLLDNNITNPIKSENTFVKDAENTPVDNKTFTATVCYDAFANDIEKVTVHEETNNTSTPTTVVVFDNSPANIPLPDEDDIENDKSCGTSVLIEENVIPIELDVNNMPETKLCNENNTETLPIILKSSDINNTINYPFEEKETFSTTNNNETIQLIQEGNSFEKSVNDEIVLKEHNEERLENVQIQILPQNIPMNETEIIQNVLAHKVSEDNLDVSMADISNEDQPLMIHQETIDTKELNAYCEETDKGIVISKASETLNLVHYSHVSDDIDVDMKDTTKQVEEIESEILSKEKGDCVTEIKVDVVDLDLADKPDVNCPKGKLDTDREDTQVDELLKNISATEVDFETVVKTINNEIIIPPTSDIESIKEEDKIADEEIVLSESTSPFVSVASESNAIHEEPAISNECQNPLETKSRVVITPPSSPKIVSKGYNFNFDEIDDPFATKTKIRMSPALEISPNTTFDKQVDDSSQKELDKNRRKSQPARKKPVVPKNKLNSTFSGPVKVNHSIEKVNDKFTKNVIQDNSSSDLNTNVMVVNSDTQNNSPVENIKSPVTNIASNLNETNIIVDTDHENNPKMLEETKTTKIAEFEKSTEIPEEFTNKYVFEEKSLDDDVKNKAAEAIFTEKISAVESITSAINVTKTTSSSEQSEYYSAGTSSGEGIAERNVYNLPEIADINFNPFVTKSKMRQSPPPDLSVDNDKDPNNVSKPDATENELNKLDCPTVEVKESIVLDDKDKSDNISNITCSSKTTDEKDTTVREVHTEDDDTQEGPFFETDDNDKMSDFDGEDVDMMQFTELPPQNNDENIETGEMFIDAEAFEFLLNQNKSNIVSDCGKESLFLKFDPLFAKRVSSDGVLAALNKVQKRQSTPKKITPSVQMNTTFERPVAGPSSFNITQDVESNITTEQNDDFNITVSKPMMVVTPAVNPVVTPRNKITTPISSNRRSITFTSPAIAAIDRLLSLSANNSLIGHDTTVTHASREQNEADLALTQLRELLAEKEINVYNLRTESKELKDRLLSMESQMKTLETESENRLRNINELNEKLSEKTKLNKSMAAVVEEYERTIASLISEMEQDKRRHNEERIQLIKERDEQTAHLASMEVSFSDLHSKYEKSKQILLTFKANEEFYRKSIKEFEDNLSKMQSNYELLKQHATSKLNHANQELEKMNRTHESDILKMNAMIKRKELHITSLEETLAQKTKANEELTAICDELINKVG